MEGQLHGRAWRICSLDLCDAWGIRFLPPPPVPPPERPFTIQRTGKEIAEHMPPFELHPDGVWWQSSGRVTFVADNSSVAGISIGQIALDNDPVAPCFRGIKQHHAQLV